MSVYGTLLESKENINIGSINSICRKSLKKIKDNIESYIDKGDALTIERVKKNYNLDLVSELKSGFKYIGLYKYEDNCLYFISSVGDDMKKTNQNILKMICKDLNDEISEKNFKLYYCSGERCLIKFS